MEQTQLEDKAADGLSDLTVVLERILDEVQSEWGVGGLDSSTLYGDFAMTVARRAVLVAREACATICDNRAEQYGEKADKTDDEKYRVYLKARAWEFSVLACDIRKMGS